MLVAIELLEPLGRGAVGKLYIATKPASSTCQYRTQRIPTVITLSLGLSPHLLNTINVLHPNLPCTSVLILTPYNIPVMKSRIRYTHIIIYYREHFKVYTFINLSSYMYHYHAPSCSLVLIKRLLQRENVLLVLASQLKYSFSYSVFPHLKF